MSWTMIGAARKQAVPFAMWFGCMGWGAACSALAAESVDWRKKVEMAATQVLEVKAEQAAWRNPVFDVNVLTTGLTRKERDAMRCEVAPRVTPVDVRHIGRMRFQVECDGATAWSKDLIVRAQVRAEVLVMATDVRAGQAISDKDVSLEVRDVTSHPDAISEMSDVLDLTSKRTLSTGQMVTRQMLLLPTLVNRGAGVSIVARHGSIQVTAPGEAMDTGRLHETVRVRNVNSGKVIRARVIGSGQVEPEGMASVN